jgi:hypothetical protein
VFFSCLTATRDVFREGWNPLKHRTGVIWVYGFAFATLLGLTACGGGGGGSATGAASVQISWTANRETAVNSPSGGYKVYYSPTAGFNIAGADVIDVPFTSGTAPTSTTLTLSSGTHHIKVVAYSTLNPAGSAPSGEIAIVVP